MQDVNWFRLGAILADVRRRSHYSQEEIARRVGIHPVTLSRIEHGKLPGLTVALFARLAEELDINPAQLLNWYPAKRFREAIAQAQAVQKTEDQAPTGR